MALILSGPPDPKRTISLRGSGRRTRTEHAHKIGQVEAIFRYP